MLEIANVVKGPKGWRVYVFDWTSPPFESRLNAVSSAKRLNLSMGHGIESGAIGKRLARAVKKLKARRHG
jgi:hypothetical protein